MRRISLALAGLLALTTVSAVQGQTMKVGYIDSQAILSEYSGAQEARQRMEESLSTYRAEVQQMGEELQQAIAQFQQQELTMNEEARAAKQREIEGRQQTYQQRISQLEEDATRRQAEVFQPVMTQIGEVIEAIRVEGNYAMIFDVASQAVVSADPALDLTQEVLSRLQVGAQSGSGAS